MSGIQQVRPKLGAPDFVKDSLELARFCAQTLDSKKTEEIVIRDVRKSFQITDYFILGSGKLGMKEKKVGGVSFRKWV